MSKIAIIGVHNLHLMQFLYKYTDILDENGIDYDVLYWDRDMDPLIVPRKFKGKPIAFECKMSSYQKKIKKLGCFIKCFRFLTKQIKKGDYDRYILLTTQTALPLYILSRKIRKNSYIFDYRDITYEKIGICKKLIRKIIDKSVFTSISSLGFKEVLGESEKYIVSHNASNIEYIPVVKTEGEKKRFVYWGIVRQIEFNKRVCDLFGNDSRVELYYHGEGDSAILKEYCLEKQYHNINFTGRYMVNQIDEFASNTDVLINLYENDGCQKLATTVKLYDGIKYNLPMLVSKGSHMADIMKENHAVMAVDVENCNVDDVVGWCNEFNDNKEYLYKKELEQTKKDDYLFREKLLKFCSL